MDAPEDACDVSEESSEEDLQRLQEAAWDPSTGWSVAAVAESRKGQAGDFGGERKKLKTFAKPSLRQTADDHEHDGNELQTTPEFRAHVGKKLTALLDSFISISKVSGEALCTSPEDDQFDSGFRLFSTSLPEGDTIEPPPMKHRAVTSSSDSENEEALQKLKEAAVSSTLILLDSGILCVCPETMQVTDQEVEPAVKKKKKRKKKKERQLRKEEDSNACETQCKQLQSDRNGSHTHLREVDATAQCMQAECDNAPHAEQQAERVLHFRKKNKKKSKCMDYDCEEPAKKHKYKCRSWE